MKRPIPTAAIVTALALILLTGCSENEKLAQMAEKAADRQAGQNKEMARLNREVAEGTKLLVEADAEARADMIDIQKDLCSQQAEVGYQRDELEAERQDISAQRLRESLLAPIIDNLGPLLVVVAVLFFCGLLVHSMGNGKDDAIGEVLIEELVAERPTLLPSRDSRQGIDSYKPMSPIISDHHDADTEDHTA